MGQLFAGKYMVSNAFSLENDFCANHTKRAFQEVWLDFTFTTEFTTEQPSTTELGC